MEIKERSSSPLQGFLSDRQVGLLAALTLAGWLAGALWPGLLLTLGIHDYGTHYLDSYAVLASLDAMRAGADPHAPNPLDPLMRGHVYSDWWLALRWLGLTRADNFAVGTAWVGAFAVTVWATARPRRLGETLWLVALLLSPPFMLAIKRANNDLVIFVLLAGCSLAATASLWWRQLVAVSCLVFATGLKYFPAPAALAFLWVRPVRRMPAALLAALLAVLLALASVWPDIDRSRFTVGSTVHTMGAPLWWRELGWKDADSAVPSFLLIVAAAAVLALGRITVGLVTHGKPPERLRAALGAIVLLTCFASGVNYAYRWIFIIWPALWLWREATDVSLPGRSRRAAQAGCALVLLSLWLDGLLCLTVNRFMPVMSEAGLVHLQIVWRLWTQPVDWLLMMLLAGWLLEGGLTTVREWWSLRHES
jgi:hypothetical protein